MISHRTIIYAFLCTIASTKAETVTSNSSSGSGPGGVYASVSGPGTASATRSGPSGETTVSVSGPGNASVSKPFPPVYPVQSQDDIDAQTIVDSKMSEPVIASILPYREKDRRLAINQQIKAKNGGVAFIDDNYTPQDSANTPFKDLCYSLMKDEAIVLSGYLSNFFHHQDETSITIALVLTKDMENLKKTYDNLHKNKFQKRRKQQKRPFRNMLRVWCEKNREPDECEDLNTDNVKKDADALKSEQEDGGWRKHRYQIELILMKKSMKYARAVITEFEQANGNKPIEDIINGNIESHDLNHDLADAYSSLAIYIKDKYRYIADIMRKYSDDLEHWEVWNMCMAVTSREEWPKIDEAFKKNHKDDSLSKFILQKMTNDQVMAEMIAAIIDPNCKPTTFVEKPVQQSTSPPPTPPTIIAPTVSP